MVKIKSNSIFTVVALFISKSSLSLLRKLLDLVRIFQLNYSNRFYLEKRYCKFAFNRYVSGV